MPIWAYFMRKAAADPACGIDTKMTFNRPEDINTDIQIDYTNGNVPIMSGESETGGGVVETGYDAGKATWLGSTMFLSGFFYNPPRQFIFTVS